MLNKLFFLYIMGTKWNETSRKGKGGVVLSNRICGLLAILLLCLSLTACGEVEEDGQAEFVSEQEIKYFDGTDYYDEGIFYAQKELNIYEYPDLESKVVATLAVDEGIYCIGRVVSEDGKNFWVTEDKRYIPNTYYSENSRSDLREGKTTQVVVKVHDVVNEQHSVGTLHGVFDSYDDALQSMCGYTWTYIKEKWMFVDLKSRNENAMNAYMDETTQAVFINDEGMPCSYYPAKEKGAQSYHYYYFY